MGERRWYQNHISVLGTCVTSLSAFRTTHSHTKRPEAKGFLLLFGSLQRGQTGQLLGKEEKESSGAGSDGLSQCNAAWPHELKEKQLDSSSAGSPLQAWVKLQHPVSSSAFLILSLRDFGIRIMFTVGSCSTCCGMVPSCLVASPVQMAIAMLRDQ